MRKRLLLSLSLALTAAFAWVAAPALSLRPYMPGGVDFEAGLPVAKRLPAGAIAAARAAEPNEKPPRWISPPVEAPDQFDLVGVARETRPLEIRVRDHDGEWSEWVEQEDGTPVFVDGADEAQVRAPFVPRGRLHFVNVSGTADGLVTGLLNSARGAINSAFISLASTMAAARRGARPSTARSARR
jgi:hypothetical protein